MDKVEILVDRYKNNEFIQENNEILMGNHRYNTNIDWERYRKIGNAIKNKRGKRNG